MKMHYCRLSGKWYPDTRSDMIYNPKEGDELKGLLRQREKTHGNFDAVAETLNGLLDEMESSANWSTLKDTQSVALIMIQMKVARILSGNPNETDHWQDIAGYAKIANNII